MLLIYNRVEMIGNAQIRILHALIIKLYRPLFY